MNNSPWPRVALGKVIRQRKEFITIDDLTTYNRCRVQLHAQGIVLRDELEGARIKTKSQQICHADEFLVAEIDAKVGGFGIVPPDLEGAIVSSHYFLFVIDETKLDKRYLDYFIRTPDFQDQVNARGSTNYAAIRPHHVLTYEIPLPPLTEQRRIVARIEALYPIVQNATSLRYQTTEITNNLLPSILDIMLSPQKHPTVLMKEIATLIKRPVDLEKAGIVRSLGVKWWGKGPQIIEEKHGSEFRADRHKVHTDDLIYNDMWARHGSVGIVPQELDGCVASAHFPTWKLNRVRVYPPFFAWCFRSPWFWQACEDRSQGSTGRNAIRKSEFITIVMPLPPLPKQHRIVAHLDALQAKITAVQQHQAATQARLEALLPSILDRAFKGEL